MSGQDKSDQAQHYQDHGGRVNDNEHLLGVIKDFDLDPTGGDGKDEGHHLEQEEVHVLQRDPQQAHSEPIALVHTTNMLQAVLLERRARN